MVHDTSIISLASKDGRVPVTTIIIYTLRTVRTIAMISIALTFIFKGKKLNVCVKRCRALIDGPITKRMIEAYIPHAANLILTVTLVRTFPESDWLVILTKEFFAISVLFLEIHMAYILTLVLIAFKSIMTQVIEHYNLLAKGQNKAGLVLYLEEPYMIKSLEERVDMSKIRQTHKKLFNIMQDVSQCYGYAVLFSTIACRVGFIVNVYYYLSRFAPGFLVSLFLNFKQIFLICFSLEKLKNLELELLDHLNDFDMSFLNKRTRLEFKIFQQQVVHLKVQFIALNLFTFYYEIVANMITATITYMLILIQMDA